MQEIARGKRNDDEDEYHLSGDEFPHAFLAYLRRGKCNGEVYGTGRADASEKWERIDYEVRERQLVIPVLNTLLALIYETKKTQKPQGFLGLLLWCRGEDLNLHALASART